VILFPATVFTVIMLIINVFYPIYFDIDYASNTYTVGDFLWIHYLVIASVYIYFLIYMFLHRQKVTKTVFFTYITFFFLPVLGIVVQLLESNIFFAWNSIALGIFVAYTFFETTSGEIDYLTKLYNRKGYELYVKHLIETNKDFSLVYFDLNQFKSINDHFGHAKGDQVLIMFSESLKNVFVNSHMISRLGGDEFMVVESTNKNIIKEIEDIKNDIMASKDDVYKNVKFSYGSEVYFDDLSIDELYQMVDAKMYNNKRGSSSA
jgi:diguanylate cyclase (GGDEF)-like protein